MNTNDFLEFSLKFLIYEKDKLLDIYTRYSGDDKDYIEFCEKELDRFQKCKWAIQKAIDIYNGVFDD